MENLVILIFSNHYKTKFNQHIDNLPTNLQYLYLNESFEKPINNFPYGLKRLKIKSDTKLPYKMPFECELNYW